LSTVQDRGDAIYIVDSVSYGQNLATVTTQAAAQNSSYAATYWPWLQVVGPETGKLLWVPASVVMPAVYAFTDQVSAAWFAPAGINRGGLPGVVQAERRLSPSDRDTLYSNKVNPLATFPGTGVVAYGQKTLQTQATALDRVNVRRLLIDLKRYIGGISRQLVFEQNTAVTRNRFLNQVNPYLTTVQQRQGLYAFKVVMDDSNNTADVVDRNQLVGQVYLQPTKTAEFILIDFNITPTGASFPA
jgi:phage tail sheath protein FI